MLAFNYLKYRVRTLITLHRYEPISEINNKNNIKIKYTMTSRRWCFTLNNYNEVDEERIKSDEVHSKLKYLIYGREVGISLTPHLQGFLITKQPMRMTAVKALLGNDTIHLESAAGRDEQAIEYCRKDGDIYEYGVHSHSGQRTDLDIFKASVKDGNRCMKFIREHHSEIVAKYPNFVKEYVRDNIEKPIIVCHPFRKWQAWLNAKLNRDPNDREVIFIVDKVGNSGKTWFAKWYVSRHDHSQYICPGRRQDVAHLIESNRVYFMDCARSMSEFIPYHLIEEIKNGMVFSSKYQSHINELRTNHIVVLTNEYPSMTKLSADRYKIKVINAVENEVHNPDIILDLS